MTLHVVLGPCRCIACDMPVVWGWVEGLPGKNGTQRRWRDPVTFLIHRCKRETE